MRETINDLGGRRFLLTCWCVNASILLTVFGKISGGEFVTVISLTAAAYIAGNGVQKFLEAKKDENIN